MRGILSIRTGLLVVTAAALGAVPARAQAEGGGDVLKPAKPVQGPTTLAKFGEQQLERLPGDWLIVRTSLGAGRPVAVTNAYVMHDDLLVVEETGRVTCLSRRDLSPRWMWTLSGAVDPQRPPSEGSGQYVFLTRSPNGQYTVDALNRRNGLPAPGYPVRLPYGVSSGVAANTSMVWIGSLGGVRDNKTVASLELATGTPGWGWYTTGMLRADPQLDPRGQTLILCGDDGVVTALPATVTRPANPAWVTRGSGAITCTPAVTPEHVVIGSHDGLVRCLDLRSGEVLWMKSVGEAVRTCPWVIGRAAVEERSSGVEGAPPIKVDTYQGLAFARNVTGTHCFDLGTGDLRYTDASGARPLALVGKWLLTVDGNRRVTLRDSSDKFAEKGQLELSMFDLLPTNELDGTLYGVTADGYIVMATPR